MRVDTTFVCSAQQVAQPHGKGSFFTVKEDANEAEEDDDHNSLASGVLHPARCTLLIDGESNFCVGPKEKVHALLDVDRYILQWPLIPIAELHASSVQHPDDPSMRWLLHSRRVQCLPIGDVTQLAKPSAHSLCQRWH